MKKAIFIVIAAVALGMASSADAAGSVRINEVAWMGSVSSANAEWIELANTSNQNVDLLGWVLESSDSRLKIKLDGIIDANGYFLAERTDDNSVPLVKADLIYKGALSNSGMDLRLYDADGNMVDEVNASKKWPAGDNSTKQTMERTDDDIWQTSQDPGGTPQAVNDVKSETLNPQSETNPNLQNQNSNATAEPSDMSSQLPDTSYSTAPHPTGVIISELMPSPSGPDATNEWIEVANASDQTVDISGWKLQDQQGVTHTYAFPAGTLLQARAYLAVWRPDSGIMLNDSDGVNLLFADSAVADSVSFPKAPVGQSYALADSQWQWTKSPTPGSANTISQAEATNPPPLKKNASSATSKKSIQAAAATQALTPFAATQPDSAWFMSPWTLLIAALVAVGLMGVITYWKKAKKTKE